MQSKVFEGLNPEQEAAARHIFGPCYITAGPGSGKSLVIVRKIANAIQNGVDPSSIILFTFTNKAAREIKERVKNYVGEKANQMTIGTYHSVCARLLRYYAAYIGYDKNFTILDAEDSLNIINDLCKGTSLNGRAVASYISEQKRNMINYQCALQNAINSIDSARAEIYRNYEKRIKAQNSMDFDNLILMTVKLLSEHQDVQEVIHGFYRMIYADESHDSSRVDLELIRLLLNEQQNLTMIFDTDQAIYSFRGADIDNVMAFRSSFNNLQEFVLNQNYRSTQTIVNASTSLIKNNPKLIEKQLFSKNEPGDKIIYSEEQTSEAEANRIVNYINYMRSEKYNVGYDEMAILYRTNNQSFEIEKALLKHNIPYELVGRINFYSRKEIKDLISYLRFAFNPYDYEAFKRIINIPKRGIGPATLQKFFDYACEAQVDLLTALSNHPDKLFSKKAESSLQSFTEIIQVIRNAYLFSPPVDALNYLIDEIEYINYLANEENCETRIENINQLKELSQSFSSVEEMLEQSSLSSDEDKTSEKKVNVMTMHSAKGLEWDCVFVAGCNEELCPFIRAIGAGNVEEERRLFYVALTRAKKYLFLTRSRSMLQNGHFKFMKESRFIKEIDKDYLFKMPPTNKK